MERYRQIVELSQDCIKELDLDGVIQAVNDKGLKLLGATQASQVLQRTWSDLWPADVRGTVDAAIAAAKRGDTTEFEAPCVNFAGALRHWHVRVSPLRENDQLIGILAVSSDVSERAASGRAFELLHSVVENKLHATQSRLLASSVAYQQLEAEHHAAVQGRDVAHAAQRAAELIAFEAQKGEAVGQLLAGVVHDLNNVLHSASTAIDLVVQRGAIAGADAMLLGVAERALQHGAVMAKRLVGFARQHPFKPEQVQLADFVEEILPLLQQAVGSVAQLSIDICHEGCCAMVDRHTLERALMNLVINARDASAMGGSIRIETGETTLATGDDVLGKVAGFYVTLSVSDDGEGMTEDVQARAFEVYFTTKEVGKGSGLGLPQVYAAVRQAGGFIDIVSAPGRGTRIVLAFPKVSGAD